MGSIEERLATPLYFIQGPGPRSHVVFSLQVPTGDKILAIDKTGVQKSSIVSPENFRWRSAYSNNLGRHCKAAKMGKRKVGALEKLDADL